MAHIGKWILRSLGALLLLGLLAFLAIRTQWVQEKLTARILKELSQRWELDVQLGSIYLTPFSGLELNDLLIPDSLGDTLIYARHIYLSDVSPGIFGSNWAVGGVQLESPRLNIIRYRGQEMNSLQWLLMKFKDPDQTPTSLPRIRVGAIQLSNGGFVFRDEVNFAPSKGINWRALEIMDLQMQAAEFSMANQSWEVLLRQLSFNERSGFSLNSFGTRFSMDSSSMSFAELEFTTAQSQIQSPEIKWTFKNGTKSLGQFTREIIWESNIEAKNLNTSDLGYFTSFFEHSDLVLELKAEMLGSIHQLNIPRFELQFQDGFAHGDLGFADLLDPGSRAMDLKVHQLKIAEPEALQWLQILAPEAGLRMSADSQAYLRLDSGMLKGTMSEIRTRGRLRGFSQDLDWKGQLAFGTAKKVILDWSYSGSPARVFPDVALHKAKGQGRTIWQGRSWDGGTGNTQFEFSILEYENISLKKFNGQAIATSSSIGYQIEAVGDSGLRAQLKGHWKRGQVPDKFVARGSVALIPLHQIRVWNHSMYFTGDVDLSSNMKPWHDLVLQGQLSSIVVHTPQANLNWKSARLELANSDSVQYIKFLSPVISTEVQGRIDPDALGADLKHALAQFLPWMDPGKGYKFRPGSQEFKVRATIGDLSNINKIFMPPVLINGPGKLELNFNNRRNMLSSNVILSSVQYGNLRLDSLIIDQDLGTESYLSAGCQDVRYKDTLVASDFSLSGTILEQKVEFNAKVQDVTQYTKLDYNGTFHIYQDSALLEFLPSELMIGGNIWNMDPGASIVFTAERYKVHGFMLTHENEMLTVNGTMGPLAQDILNVQVKDLNLQQFNVLTSRFNTRVQGHMDASAVLTSTQNFGGMSGQIQINELVYNDLELGTLRFNSDLNAPSGLVKFRGIVENEVLRTVDFNGLLHYKMTGKPIQASIELQETPLELFEQFTVPIADQLSGQMTAKVDLDGSLDAPQLTGWVNFEQAGFRIMYLNTYYWLTDRVQMDQDRFKLTGISVQDVNGNRARISGSVKHRYLSSFYLDLIIDAQKFQCLNTTATPDALYYGQAVATGQVRIKGPLDQIDISVQASTDRGTEFKIPISDPSTVGEKQFISFISKDSLPVRDKQVRKKISGITMNFDLDIKPEAQTWLIFDEQAGDIMKGSGEGYLKLLITTAGTFEMFGTYRINEGEYLFTLEDLIKKKFQVRDGGILRWTGNPYEATMDLSAVYRLRANSSVLKAVALGDTSGDGSRIPVHVILNLEGRLMSPGINFEIEFPEDPYLAAQLGSFLLDKDNVTQQSISLLAFGSFTGSGAPGGAFLAGGEIFRNQFALWLNQFTNEKTLSVNSLSGRGGSISLLENRIIVEGNFNESRPDQLTGQNSVTGDLSVEYKISEDGRFRVKAFNKSHKDQLSLARTKRENLQGVGLFYGVEYESLGELWDIYFRKSKNLQLKDSVQ